MIRVIFMEYEPAWGCGGALSWTSMGTHVVGPELGCWVHSTRDRDVHIPCCVPSREAFTIPLIPLGLKETKDVDFSVVLKVNLKAMGT